jgi:formate hydrogenlyase subunit 3/multisubunit Na+/H+ antiporter MnhD subunit
MGAVFFGFFGSRRGAPLINVGLSLATFALSVDIAVSVLKHGPILYAGEQLYADAFSALFIALTGFVGATTSVFSLRYMQIQELKGHVTADRTRVYLSLYQVFILTMLLVLVSNNLGLLWVALEGATLATVLLVAWSRSPSSVKAAWKYFILCGVGIAQALFGTILLYFAAEKMLGPGGTALLWTHLNGVKTQLEPTVIGLAFVFFIVGYGTKVGLVPLHSWLPDAHAEGPTPISAVLSGLLLNAALYAILRVKVLADGTLHNNLPSHLLMGFGLISMLLGSFSMWNRQDIKRLFAYSSIEHMGLSAFAFGLGGSMGAFAGLLHMTAHSLVKSSLFFVVGHAVQMSGTQKIGGIRNLLVRIPSLGWALVVGGFGITGTPPFAIFASEFLIVTNAIRKAFWSVPFILLALLVTFGVVMKRIFEMGKDSQRTDSFRIRDNNEPVLALGPIWLHFGLALLIGLFFPLQLANWFHTAILSVGLAHG